MSNQHSEVQPLTNNRLTREERSPWDLHVVRRGGGGGLKKKVGREGSRRGGKRRGDTTGACAPLTPCSGDRKRREDRLNTRGSHCTTVRNPNEKTAKPEWET